MEAAVGMLSRVPPALGLVRRSPSFSQAGSTSLFEAVPVGGFPTRNLPPSMDGVAGETAPLPSSHSQLDVLRSSTATISVPKNGSLRPGAFAWPEIDTQERSKLDGFALDSLLDQAALRKNFWGRVETGQGMSRVNVVGHRGSGKNKSKRVPWVGGVEGLPDVRENTLKSFTLAGNQGADYVEFDVQVTRDSHAVIFHDDHIRTADDQVSMIGELTLDEFRGMGPQEEASCSGWQLLRRASDGVVEPWVCAVEDSLCTLEEAFRIVAQRVGFNVEVKFLDFEESLDEIRRVVTAVVASVKENAAGRRIIFSTFHPDAAILLRQLQDMHPVFFLTDGGTHLYKDLRRNSLAAAIDVCLSNQLHGIVSEVTAVLRQPEMIKTVQSKGLKLYTYGEENNLPEAVFFQQFQGVDGVIVDNVRPVANLVRSFSVRSAPSVAADKLPLEQLPVPSTHRDLAEKPVAIRAT